MKLTTRLRKLGQSNLLTKSEIAEANVMLSNFGARALKRHLKTNHPSVNTRIYSLVGV